MDDEGGFGATVRLMVTALVSAAITATLVIGLGRALLPDPVARAPATGSILIQTQH